MPHLPHIHWSGSAETGHLRLLDQTRLPTERHTLECRAVQDVWDAIKRLSVRGAPAIGIAAAYGCVLGAQREAFADATTHLATSRPTAVNLFWALDRMRSLGATTPAPLLAEAKRIHTEDEQMCRRIGEHGLPLIGEHTSSTRGILTHCNAGALATGGIGTATAPMYLAHEQGRPLVVYADETRPLLQGARLTAYELGEAGIDVTLICDDMAAHIMQSGRVGMVLTGADRIAANGDVANKIGTYGLAVLAHHHAIPFYVAAPSTTFDFSTAEGADIPIEQRASEEITDGFGHRTAPVGTKTYSPAFDVTPHNLVSGLVTEKGLIRPVNEQGIRRVLKGNGL